MSQDNPSCDAPPNDPCCEDTQKAVELSIVILVDEEKCCPPPPPPPPCPPPCCIPCCSRRVPPCPTQSRRGESPCPKKVPPRAASPCGKQHTPTVRTGMEKGTICVDVDLTGEEPEPDVCGNLPKSQSGHCQASIQCQTAAAACQTVHTPKTCCRQRDKGLNCQMNQTGEAPDMWEEDNKVLVVPRECKKKRGHMIDRSKKKRHPSKSRRASVPATSINFENCPSTPKSFVRNFLKGDSSRANVLILAEAKIEYERSSKLKLAKVSKASSTQAQQFFTKVVDAINTPTPDIQKAEIQHYHIMKFLNPALQALNLEAGKETHVLHKYHMYILTVIKTMNVRIKAKQRVDPSCMVEIMTKLLAGFTSRCFPIFIKIKDQLTNLISAKGKPNPKLTPDEYITHITRILACIYVEIACIDAAFNKSLNSQKILPDTEMQACGKQLSVRRKHAHHAIKWAAKCLATNLLYYFMIDM